ncbi:MAG: hypothetical protein ACXVAR_10810 [Vulcanimicrobiaceae bacterium]
MTETSYRRFGLVALVSAALGLMVAAEYGGGRSVAIAAVPAALLAAAGAVLIHFARIHHDETSKVLALLEGAPISGFTVAPIANELELWEFWKTSRDMYGDENALRFETYLAWWRCYPSGVFGLFQNGALVGGLSVWPLRRRAFYEALKGRHTISHRAFRAVHDAKRCEYWYVAGVVVKPGFRRRDALQYLFSEVMHHGLSTARDVMRLNLCAAASSPEGARLLQRFGFAPVAAERRDEAQLTAYALRGLGPVRLRKMADRFAALGVRKQGSA